MGCRGNRLITDSSRLPLVTVSVRKEKSPPLRENGGWSFRLEWYVLDSPLLQDPGMRPVEQESEHRQIVLAVRVVRLPLVAGLIASGEAGYELRPLAPILVHHLVLPDRD